MDEWTKPENEQGNPAPSQQQQQQQQETGPNNYGPSPGAGMPPFPPPYQPYPPYPPGRRKKKGAAGFLSFLFPGLGHFYSGAMQRGLFFMLLFVGTIVAIVFFSEVGFVPLIVLMSVMLPVQYFYCLFDSLQTVDRINNGEPYPQAPIMGGHGSSSYGGSPFPPIGSTYRRSISGNQVGIVLIGLGVFIFLAANKPVWLEQMMESTGSIIGAAILIGAGLFLFMNESRKNKR